MVKDRPAFEKTQKVRYKDLSWDETSDSNGFRLAEYRPLYGTVVQISSSGVAIIWDDDLDFIPRFFSWMEAICLLWVCD
jgi:hypothetical protein